jgi:hypothetical protein
LQIVARASSETNRFEAATRALQFLPQINLLGVVGARNAFEPILAWAVIEPCGKLALFSIATTPDQAKEFFLASDETEGWNALATVGVRVVAITIKPSQGNESALSAAAEIQK